MSGATPPVAEAAVLTGPDVRVCFVGDSFVAGVGDPQHLGWAGRLAAHSHTHGQVLTAYNLGIRRDTSADVLARWQAECSRRLVPGSSPGVVFSFGVNDTTAEQGAPRVAPEDSVANLELLLRQADAAGWPVLVAGPPAVDDEQHNGRTAGLDEAFVAVCALRGVPYVSVVHQLRGHEVWRQQVRDGDGAHPGAEGYQALAELVLPSWVTWLTAVGARPTTV